MGKTASLANIGTIADSSLGFRNRLINGSMVIDQRNAGASVSISSSGFPVDRFLGIASGGGVFSGQQSSTAPTGFKNSTVLTVTTADASIAATDYYFFEQNIEGYNVADLGFGAAGASTVTVSFWVRSSITGTFSVALLNNDRSRTYTTTYTISAANTWEQKTVTIAGDTTGTWQSTNSTGIKVRFDLGSGSNRNGTAGSWQSTDTWRTSGSTNWIATNEATFYITGVQLEKGSTATSFDYRPYGTELQLCQRYLPALNGTHVTLIGYTYNSNASLYVFNFPVTARVPATGVTVSSVSHFLAYNGSNTSQAPSTISFNISNPQMGSFTTTQASGFTIAQPSRFEGNNASGQILFTGCEL